MSQQIKILDDLKTAAVLAGCTGLFGALTVPVLLPSVMELVPPEQRTLPLPLPLFCLVLAIQFLIVYGVLALAGLRLARARAREPAPVLTALWTGQRSPRFGLPAALAFATGLVCGLTVVGVIALVKAFLPQTLPQVMHPASVGGALLASATASFGEEILCRLFLLSALLRVLPLSRASTAIAVAASALLFGALHSPAAVFLFGGLENVTSLFWVWMLVLNALIGVLFAVWYLHGGIGGAILVHLGTDVVWHGLSQLV